MEKSEDIFRGHGVEIKLDIPDDFLLVKETLSRIGIASKKDNTLYPSCVILHKQGRYAIMHFKEMFLIGNKEANISADDYQRRNRIVSLLEEWELLTVLDPNKITEKAPMSSIKVISFKDKKDWKIVEKFTPGRKSR